MQKSKAKLVKDFTVGGDPTTLGELESKVSIHSNLIACILVFDSVDFNIFYIITFMCYVVDAVV